MITIKFHDPEKRLEALGFLLGRLLGRALKTGEVLVPEAALLALAYEGYQSTVPACTSSAILRDSKLQFCLSKFFDREIQIIF